MNNLNSAIIVWFTIDNKPPIIPINYRQFYTLLYAVIIYYLCHYFLLFLVGSVAFLLLCWCFCCFSTGALFYKHFCKTATTLNHCRPARGSILPAAMRGVGSVNRIWYVNSQASSFEMTARGIPLSRSVSDESKIQPPPYEEVFDLANYN